MRSWMKYWLMAVSSAERTSCRTLRISGLPFIAPPDRATRVGAGSYPARPEDVSFGHERKGSSGPPGRRLRAEAMERGVGEGVLQGAAVEARLDDGLGRAGRAARGPGHAARLRLRARHRLARRVPLHARRPPDG